jgi:hypothetical protein
MDSGIGGGAGAAAAGWLGVMGMAASGEGVSGAGVFAFRVRGLVGSVEVVFGAVLRAVVVLAGAGDDGEAVSGRGFFRGRPRFFAIVCSVDIGAVGERNLWLQWRESQLSWIFLGSLDACLGWVRRVFRVGNLPCGVDGSNDWDDETQRR